MKIFTTGDTHGNFERFRPEYFPEGQELTKEDVVLQLGDFGGVWFGDERDDEALDWLKGLPFTVAFVSGNHENYDALVKYPIENWHGGRVQPVRPHVLHLMRGQVFELAGRTFFTMGGAASHDIEDGILSLEDPNFERKYLTLKRKEHARFRIDHLSWWREELPSEEEYAEARRNLDAHGWAVDYILTHCAPTSIALQFSETKPLIPSTSSCGSKSCRFYREGRKGKGGVLIRRLFLCGLLSKKISHHYGVDRTNVL